MKCFSRPERVITLNAYRIEPTRLLEMVIIDINSLVVRFNRVVFCISWNLVLHRSRVGCRFHYFHPFGFSLEAVRESVDVFS